MKLLLRSLAVLTLCQAASPQTALAQQAAPAQSSGPMVNNAVFSDASIAAVTAVTEVFGDGQKITAAIVELTAPVAAKGVALDAFSVDARKVTALKVVASADIAAPAADGRFVVLSLDPGDAAATVYGSGIDTAAQIVVRQTVAITALADQLVPDQLVPDQLAAGPTGVLNTRVQNLIVDDFQTYRFTDPTTGLSLDYNLYIPKYIPKTLDPSKTYPLVMFLHDAGVIGSNPKRTLQQGLGAISFASPMDQAKHPSFVLAPQIPVALANDAAQTSPYVEMLPRLIAALQGQYPIDGKRLYTTGQSGGCMTSLALNVAHPDLFAGTLCVAGQWQPAIATPPASAHFWGVVSEDDSKAFPGMGAIMAGVEAKGTPVARGTLDAKADAAAMASAVAGIRADAGSAHVFFTAFAKGTVLQDGSNNPGAGHMRTWFFAYSIPALRDWLFEQSK